jgi:hypothetical protein
MHGIVFYELGTTGLDPYNYWVWEATTTSTSGKFRVGTASNYIDFAGSSLTIQTSNFKLSSNNLEVASGTFPYIRLGDEPNYLDPGIWMGLTTAGSVYTTMTSNVLPAGQVASAENESSTAYYVFNNATGSYLELNTTTNTWVQIKLPKRRAVTNYRIYTTSSLYCPDFWYLKASNDGVNWTIIDYRHDISAWSGSSSVYEISDLYEAPYLYYRLHILSLATANPARIDKLLLNQEGDYKLSLVSGDAAENHLSWDGHSLDIKGDLYLGAGDNGIYFEDSNIYISDEEEALLGVIPYRYITFSGSLVQESLPLLNIGYVGDDFSDPSLTYSIMELNNYFYSSDYPNYLRAVVREEDEVIQWYIKSPTSNSYPFQGNITITRAGDEETNGYVDVGFPVTSPVPVIVSEQDKSNISYRYPDVSAWTDPEDCPFADEWIWLKTTGLSSTAYVKYHRTVYDHNTYVYYHFMTRVSL